MRHRSSCLTGELSSGRRGGELRKHKQDDQMLASFGPPQRRPRTGRRRKAALRAVVRPWRTGGGRLLERMVRPQRRRKGKPGRRSSETANEQVEGVPLTEARPPATPGAPEREV